MVGRPCSQRRRGGYENLLKTTGWRLSEATICLRNLNRTCPNGRSCTGCLPGGPTFDHMHLWLRPNSRRKVLQIQPYDVEEDLLNDWSAEHSLVWEHRQDINWWGGDTKSIIIYPAEDPSP